MNPAAMLRGMGENCDFDGLNFAFFVYTKLSKHLKTGSGDAT